MRVRHILWACLLLAPLLSACVPATTHDMSYQSVSWQTGVLHIGSLLKQDLGKQYAVELLAKRTGLVKTPAIVFDPLVYLQDGQQPVVNRRIGKLLAQAMQPDFTLLPLTPGNLKQAGLCLSGTISPLKDGGGKKGPVFLLKVVVIDKASGEVKAVVRMGVTGLPLEPYALYQDSPTFLKGASLDLTMGAVDTPLGRKAPTGYLALLPAQAELQVGLQAYQEKKYRQALQSFQEAARLNQPPILAALSGEFLCLRKLGEERKANQAFHKLLANSIEQRQRVDFRLLFKVDSPYFLENATLVARYAWWLRHLARYVQESGACLEIIGHCSHTGNEKYNDRLSLQRAKLVQGIMAVTYPEVKQKTRVTGMGWRENIVGTGADNVTDAIDRRVEFKVIVCAK